jgi:AAA+ ATPase superfamily predicted ATPase
MKAMKNIIGKPVAGENFFGRERELQELSRISEDEHVLLLAPRRVGKIRSSAARRFTGY